MPMNLRHAVGSLMVVGLAAREVSPLERGWLRVIRPGGVIFFRRNIESAAQCRAMLAEASSLCAERAFRCVDMEGGSVDRLRNVLAPTSSAQSLFLAAQQLRRPALVREQAELIARAVSAFGFNTNLAPVLDLALPVATEVMGSRVVSADPLKVADFARQFLDGLQAHGVAGCGKHFPGLGGGALDSHQATPAIERTMKQMRAEDLVPFRILRKDLPMIMVSHAAFPRTPGKNTPASASHFWITKLLREEMGYRGIVFSDDLEMGGILKFMPMEEAAIAAIRAGMDMIEICHSPELILRAYEALLAEAERSSAFRAIVMQRAARLSRARRTLFAAGTARALTAKQLEALRARMVRLADKIAAHQPVARAAQEA
jgi:beta-N-acetylhexosaminidase